MIALIFGIAEPATRCIDADRIRQLAVQPRLQHSALQVQLVVLFIMGPAPVGQEVAVRIDCHAAQPVARQILVITGRLHRQAGVGRQLELQPAVRDQAATAGKALHRVEALVEQASPARDHAIGVDRPGHFARRAIAIIIADHRAHRCGELVLRLLSDIIDHAARRTGAIEHADRSFEKLDPVDAEQVRHGEALERVAAQPVIEHRFLPETAIGNGGILVGADARDIAIKVGDVACALIADQLAGDDLHRLGNVHGISRDLADLAILDAIEFLCAGGDQDVAVAGGRIKRGLRQHGQWREQEGQGAKTREAEAGQGGDPVEMDKEWSRFAPSGLSPMSLG